MKHELRVQQLFDAESSTYTYLVYDEETKEAALIDSVLEQVDRDLSEIRNRGLRLKYLLETHVHADHITGARRLRELTGAGIAVSEDGGAEGADLYIKEGTEIALGTRRLRALKTPGHTAGCVSFVSEGIVFTGDALMILDVGRTDFQGGSTDELYRSITRKLFTLPEETIVYPAHDYRGKTQSSVREEKAGNVKLGGAASLDEFREKVAATKLGQPKKIHMAVPANLRCGTGEKDSAGS